MPMLIPCPGCQRHVRMGDAACPFCGVSVRSSTASRTVSRPSAGLKRAALFALSATVAASACGSESEDSGKSPAAASQATDSATGMMPTPTATDQPSEEGDSPSDTATTGTLPGILPGEPNPTQPTPKPSDTGDNVDDPPVVEPEPSMEPAPTMQPDPTPPKPTGPSSPPTAVALYGAVPAPIDELPVDDADAGTGDFDPEGNAGAPDIDEPEAEGGAGGGSGGRNEQPPQVQPLYGAVPAPQE